ncbi:asparagine synthase-related protein [Butyrivibrio sp. XBB1001]|uniref:asparagine synthase-related protein n=1 Tax=Butyrivibrio sp. XBB1001 TaxID=1280682 RepID=UPI0004125630|nr:asparagine synthase-related protein [Butyrivibrio sp. XBB1001]
MSAIWGYISFDSEVRELNTEMKKTYEDCAIDRFEETAFDRGFFSCGIQFFTKEAEYERLPIKDLKRGIVFTGDIVLNGRDELIDEIKTCLSDGEIRDFSIGLFGEKDPVSNMPVSAWPDGVLTYLAYSIWNEDFTEHIQGLFAIAVYDTDQQLFRLYTDHMGTRCVYYSICGKELFFSSLSRPIYNCMPSEYRGINEKWITGCQFTNTAAMVLFPELTPFDNIYQVVRGQVVEVRIDGENVRKAAKEYYRPTCKSIIHDKPDSYYRENFRKIFWKCVEDAMRCRGAVAATISSGLDSTSVAAVAASILSEKGGKLYGFTSVPLKDYVNTYDEGYIPDESEGVKQFCKKYENIEPTFTSCEGKSAFTEMDELIHKFEVPGKALINQVWMIDIVKRMKEKGCQVLLNGQYGNFTLSSGNVFSRVFHELYGGNIREAKRQLAAFGKRYGVPRKILLKAVWEEALGKLLFDLNIDSNYKKSFDRKYLKRGLLEKHRIIKRDRYLYKMRGYNDCEPRVKQNNLVLDETFTETMGIFDTKISIYYGVLFRDPTRDKRMADLCISFPEKAFTDDGLERRLVREYLKDMIPDSIRLDPGHRGVQSPDAVLRLKKFGNEKMRTPLTDQIYEYFNEGNVKELFKQDVNEENHKDIVRILAMDCFLREYAS